MGNTKSARCSLACLWTLLPVFWWLLHGLLLKGAMQSSQPIRPPRSVRDLFAFADPVVPQFDKTLTAFATNKLTWVNEFFAAFAGG